jgi:predicted nucleotidyltransferase component of viral defense system
MAFNDAYRRQVALLVRTLPHVAAEECFALKGGTAINLFVRDMPRLSVDIDLTYLPVEPREHSLAAIAAALTRIADRILAAIPGAKVSRSPSDDTATKLIVRADGTQIKIEVTPVLRGCVFEPEVRAVAEAVEDAFGFAEIAVVSFADLYAGKIVAALDRQHPRDLFDVRDLLAGEGIDEALRQAFVIYLISHDRPMWEVLAPARKDFSEEFLRGFEGMTEQPIFPDELAAVRETLVKEIVGHMPGNHRRFLISFERGDPDWTLIGIPSAADLPAVRWRQQNLNKLSAERRSALVARLEEVFDLAG